MPDDDLHFMSQALALARETIALASPNPQVGCVLTKNDHVIGQGAHLYEARDHAEIAALKQAATLGHSPRGATAYVTLEPCAHHGRTGPCADALIAAGITRCVVATADPNPQVAGQGIARLRAAGIAVTVGICQSEARTLNNAFAFAITHNRPFVSLKAALSTDGMIAPAAHLRPDVEPHWLTGPLARAEVQQLRHASDAILVGSGTVLADNPTLTDRTGLPRRRPLQRIVLDTQLRLPLTSKLVESFDPATSDLQIFCGFGVPPERIHALRSRGIPVTKVQCPPSSGVLHLRRILDHLYRDDVRSVLLEAGSHLTTAFLRNRLVDRAILYYAPVELGPTAIPFTQGGPTPFALEQMFLSIEKQTVGPDVRVSGLIHDPWSSLPANWASLPQTS